MRFVFYYTFTIRQKQSDTAIAMLRVDICDGFSTPSLKEVELL